jgi:hypothetical protein
MCKNFWDSFERHLGSNYSGEKRGLIPSAAKVLREVQEAGLRLEDGLIRAVLHQTVGEDW